MTTSRPVFTAGRTVLTDRGATANAQALSDALANVWAGQGRAIALVGPFPLAKPVSSPPQPSGAGVPLILERLGDYHQIEYTGDPKTAALTLYGVKDGRLDVGIKLMKAGQAGLRIGGGSTSNSEVRGMITRAEGLGVKDVLGVHLGYGDANDVNAWALRDGFFDSVLMSGYNNLNNLIENATIQRLWMSDASLADFPALDHAHVAGGDCSTLINMCSNSAGAITSHGNHVLTILGGRFEMPGTLPPGSVPTKPIIYMQSGIGGRVNIQGLKIDWGGTLKDWIRDDPGGVYVDGVPLAQVAPSTGTTA